MHSGDRLATPQIMAISALKDMLTEMTPTLSPVPFVFCCTQSSETVSAALPDVWALVVEAEGTTLVLPKHRAVQLGFDTTLSMACITLMVHSSLQGVGLTAAVSQSLAAVDCPCNVVAGYHHDHVFVPYHRGGEALAVLQGLQQQASSGGSAE